MARPVTDQAVRILRGRIARVLFARYALSAATVWAFAWGTAALVLRIGWNFDRLTLAWGAVGWVAAMLIGLIHAARKLPGPAALAAAVDRHSNAGGLVMAADEIDTSAWADHAHESHEPPVSWDGRRIGWMLPAALVFVIGAFAVPDRIAQGLNPQHLDITDQARPVEQRITLLEQEKIIEPDTAQAMREKLDRIRRDARGDDPARTWESLDQMRHTLEQAAQKAAEDVVRQAEPLTRAESLAAAVGQAEQSGKADAQSLAEAMRQLNDQIAVAGAMQQAMNEQLKKDLATGEKPESHYQLDIERAKRLIEKARSLEPLLKKNPKDLSPVEMAKLAELAMELKKLDETQLKQLAALGAADQMLKRLPPDSIAIVDAKAKTTFFTRNAAQMKLPDMDKPQSFAARVNAVPGGLEMFEPAELDAAAAPLFDWPADLFEGQPLAIEHDAQDKLLVFSGLPSTPVQWDKLDQLNGEHIIVVEAGKQPRLFGPVDVPPCNAGQCSGEACKVARAVRMNQLAMLQRLSQAGMIDPSRIAQFQNAAADSGDGPPGSGGISRGRGDADLTWQNPRNTDNTSIQSHTLPPATLAAMKDSQQIGLSAGAPQQEETESSTGGALDATAAGGGEANTAVILPAHRNAVERYFQRQ
ncbi:MAG: hypothetical protein WC058_07145 [Phycisphaeraceae bacterium]